MDEVSPNGRDVDASVVEAPAGQPSFLRGPWTLRLIRQLHGPAFWVGALAVAFFAVSLYAESVTYLAFQQTFGNLPIFMQGLSSTSHGYIPFFESQDCMGKARCSFLLVHPGFVLYLVAPIYWALPSPFTLFTLQSLVVALATVPLFWLTRRVTGSRTKGLLAAGLFLVWAPLLATLVSAVWIESVLPLEMFTVAALWEAGRYRFALAAAALPFLTIEVGPVLGFLLGLFFLAPTIATSGRLAREAWSRWRKGTSSLREAVRNWSRAVRDGLGLPRVRYALYLMGAAAGAYVLVNVWMNVAGAGLLGVTSPSVPPGIAGVFYDNSVPRNPSILQVLISPRILFTAGQTLYTAEYWLILYALLAFIPFLCPRALILSVPWIGFTFLTLGDRFTTIGIYSGGVAAVPLFIGVAYGLRGVPLGTSGASGTPSSIGTESTPAMEPPSHSTWHGRRGRALWGGAVGIAIAANILLCPINPLLPVAHVSLGEPFSPAYFVSPRPATQNLRPLEQMIGLVPPSATVAVPPLLAPLVINDVHAYLLTNRGTSQWNNESRLRQVPGVRCRVSGV